MSPSAISRIQELCADNKLTILIFYRGEWCPFCKTWARGLSSMRKLASRLAELDAQVIFTSSQAVQKEDDTRQAFGFQDVTKHRRVHFVNDPENEMARRMNEKWGEKVVGVDDVTEAFGGGFRYGAGMLQPGVLGVVDLFREEEKIVMRYGYDSKGVGGLNGDDDRPLASTTLRKIEEAYREMRCN